MSWKHPNGQQVQQQNDTSRSMHLYNLINQQPLTIVSNNRLSKNLAPNTRIKTNTSFLSGTSFIYQHQQQRIQTPRSNFKPSIMSFLNIPSKNQLGTQNQTKIFNQHFQGNLHTQDLINQSRFEHDQQQQSKLKYDNWVTKVKQLAKLQGISLDREQYNQLQTVIKQPGQDLKQKVNNEKSTVSKPTQSLKKSNIPYEQKQHYIMLRISQISNVFYRQLEQQSKKKTQSNLYYKLIISLEQQRPNQQTKIYSKQIMTDMLLLEKDSSIINKQVKNHFKQASTNVNLSYCSMSADSFSVYFHTVKKDINVVIQLVLYQTKIFRPTHKSTHKINQIQVQTQVVVNQELIGLVKLSMQQEINQNTQKSNPKNSKISFNLVNKPKIKQFQKPDNIFLSSVNQKMLNQKKDKPTNDKDLKKIEKTCLSYVMIDSESYKLLNKFAPSQYLMWYTDFIPGVFGSHLSKLDDMISNISPSTQARSISIETQNIQIPSEWLQNGIKRFQKMEIARSLTPTQLKITRKQLKLSLLIHNSLKQVHKQSVNLIQKMQIHHKIQKTTQRKSNQQQKDQLISIKHLSSPPLSLPIVFNQIINGISTCYIILQIQQLIKVEQIQKISKVKSTSVNHINIRQFLIPVAFAFVEIDKLHNNKLVQNRFYQGYFTKEILYKNQNLLKIIKKTLAQSKFKDNISFKSLQYTSRSHITQPKMVQKQKFIQFSKITMICHIKQPIFDMTWLTSKKLEQSLFLINNQSINNMNRSATFMSSSMKIDFQKEKILKQYLKPSKNKIQRRKLHIRQEIIPLAHAQNLYVNTNTKQSQNDAQLKILGMLNRFIKQNKKTIQTIQSLKDNKSQFSLLQFFRQSHAIIWPYQLTLYPFITTQNKLPAYIHSYQQILKKTCLSKDDISLPSQLLYSEVLRKMFYYTKGKHNTQQSRNEPYSRISNNNSLLNGYGNNGNYNNRNFFNTQHQNQSLTNYHYQRVPIDIIKTELTQINYDYLILVNPLQLKPLKMHNNSLFMIPNKFRLKIYLWNMSCQTQTYLQIDPQTGEIIPSLRQVITKKDQQRIRKTDQQRIQKQKNKQKPNKIQKDKPSQQKPSLQQQEIKINLNKIIHFLFSSQQKFTNSKQIFIHFIQYLYNGLMQIKLYDQVQQIGKTYFRLRSLIRKRRNQVNNIQQQIIYSKNGPICQLKLQIKAIRTDKVKRHDKGLIKQNKQQLQKQIYQHQISAKKVSKQQISGQQKIKYQKQQQKRTTLLKNNIIQKQNQLLSRIQNFKRKKANQEPTQINEIIQKDYLRSQYHIKTYPFISTIILVELQNKSTQGIFCIKFNDQHQKYFIQQKQYEPQTPQYRIIQPQFRIIRNFMDTKELNQHQKQKILAITTNKQKLIKYKKLNINYQVELQSNQKLIIICQYFSLRKYSSQVNPSNSSHYTQFNHYHTITLSLIQSSNSIVSSLSKVHIYPEPSANSLCISQNLRKGQQKIVSLPFLLTSAIMSQYQLWMNQRRVFIAADYQNKPNSLNFMAISLKPQILPYNQSNQNISKQNNVNYQHNINNQHIINNQHNINNKNNYISQYPIDNKHLNLYFIPKQNKTSIFQCQPIQIQIILNYIQDQHVIKANLFQTHRTKIKIYHSSLFKNQRFSKFVGVVCEDINFVTKEFWLQLNLNNKFTQLQFTYTAVMYGRKSFAIKFIDPLKYSKYINKLNRNKQKVGCLQTIQQFYIPYQILLIISTELPPIKNYLSLSVSSSITIQQPFTYFNTFTSKTIFNIYSSHPWFVSIGEKDRLLEIQAKKEKKIKIFIHVQRILKEVQYAATGDYCQVDYNKVNHVLNYVILGFVPNNHKNIQYFALKFKF